MFTNEDYKNYFSEMENMLKSIVAAYTDLINMVEDRSIRSKLHALASESMDNFRFVRGEKDIFI